MNANLLNTNLMNTNLLPEGENAGCAPNMKPRPRDVAIVALAAALIVFGNVALVHAIDRALDALVG